jgi:iron complex outermembrane receptor protein
MSKLANASGVSALAILSLGMWLSPAAPACAQQTGQDASQQGASQDEGNEIVVTATRREQALQDVPIAVSAYSSEDLARLNVTSTNDIQRIAPSLVISTSNSETGGSTLRIRGVGTTGNNPGLEGAVGVFIDGIYRQRAGLALQNLFDVSRIEVLRGPQGTLFGKNTSAGALSIIPNLPSRENEMEGQVTFGDYGDLDFTGMLNVPLGPQFAVRVAGTVQTRDGVIDGVIVDNTGIVRHEDFNTRDRRLLRAMALWEPNNDFSWRITADYASKDEACCATPYSFYLPTNPSRRLDGPVGGVTIPTDPFDRVSYVNEAPVERTEEWGVSSHLTFDLSDSATLNAIAAHRRFASHNNADVDFGPADILRQRIPAVQTLDSLEANLTGSFGRLDWLVGAYWSHEQIESSNATIYGVDTGRYVGALLGGTIDPNPPHNFLTCAGLCALYGNTTAYPVGGGNISNDFDQDGASWSIFTHNTFHFTDTISATLGLRYNDEHKDGGGTNFVVNSPTCAPAYFVASLATLCPRPDYHATVDETATTGVASLNWEPTPDILAYVSYSHGYKAGGINLDRDATVGTCVSPRGVVNGACTQADIDASAVFQPEFSNSYEIGLKTQWFNHSVTANLALFKTDYEDFQLNTFNGLGFIVSNAGSVESYGAELETRWAPTHNFFGTLGVAYTHARYGDEALLLVDPDGAGPLLPLSGRQLTNAPDWTVTGSLNYEVPLSSQFSGFANVNASYRSDYNTGSDLHPRKAQEAFTLVGGQLGLRSLAGDWDLYLWGSNLTDQGFSNIIFSSVFQAGSFSDNIGDPRMYGITMRKRF